MDNKDLMRDDYVMFFNSRKIGKRAKVGQILQHSCLLLYNNFPDETDYYNEIVVNNENIHPIKLTQDIMHEIVEQNEDNSKVRLYFHMDGGGEIFQVSKYYFVKFAPNEIPCIVDQVGYTSDGDYIDNHIMDVEFVHDFQHAEKCLKFNLNINI